MTFTINILILLCLRGSLAELQKTKEIKLPNLGSVVGKVEQTLKNFKYEAFYGIPYGESPTGDNRFKDFLPVKPWNNRLKAFEPKSKCIQKNIFLGKNCLVSGKEDCLYLNIYRPMVSNAQDLLPVMIFIHGGGFFAGSAHPDVYGPEKLMKTQKVILVTFQYRLGLLGFFSTNDTAAPGNQGFKDQLGALQFIHKYIQYFHGNPEKITLVGHGAGAASAQLQLMNPQTKGLFHRMILLSGTAIAPYNEPTVNPAKQVYHLAEYCGIKNASQLSTFEVVKKLKEIDAETLIQAADYFHTNGIDPVVVFKIVLENPESKTAFITKHPKELSKTGKYYYVPILTGILENDGSVRTMSMRNNDTEIKRFNTDFNDNLAVLLAVENNDDVLGKIIDYYLKGERNLNNMTFNNFEKVVSDRAFMYPFYDAVLDLLEFSDKSLILYKFDKKVSASFSKVYTSDYIDSSTSGPVHGDDLLELFYFKTKKFNLKTNDSIDNSPFFDYIIKFITDEPMENFDVCTQEEMISKLKQNKICSYRNFGDIVELRDSFRVEDAKFWDKLLKVREN